VPPFFPLCGKRKPPAMRVVVYSTAETNGYADKRYRINGFVKSPISARCFILNLTPRVVCYRVFHNYQLKLPDASSKENGMKRSESNKMTVTSPEQIFEMATAFQTSRILLTAYELEVFSALEGRPRHSADIAETLGTDPRATDRLLNALCALGFVEKENDLFFNSHIAETFLVKGKKFYLAGLMHMVNLWETWDTLTQAVKAGHRVAMGPVKTRSSKWFEAFIAAMHQRAVMAAPEVVSRIDLSGITKVLDVGGGSGGYAMEFARANDNIRITVFDLPGVIQLTRQYVAEAGMLNRIEFAEGDYYVDELGRDFDLAFLSAIIHSNSPEQNQALFDKVSRALNPGGKMVVQDFIMDEDRTGPLFGAVFSLNMLVGTDAGDTYTPAEIKNWLGRSGFEKIQSISLQGPADIIVGHKPVKA